MGSPGGSARNLYSDDDESESGEESEGDDLEEGVRAAGKEHPLAHRCLSMGEFRQNEVLESLLDRARTRPSTPSPRGRFSRASRQCTR